MQFERSILKRNVLGFLSDVRQIFRRWLRECGIPRVVDISTKSTLSGTISEVCKTIVFMIMIIIVHSFSHCIIGYIFCSVHDGGV